MRRGIDPAGKAGGDDETGRPKIGGQPRRQFAPKRGGIARADNRHHLLLQQRGVAQHHQTRWRRIERGKPVGKLRLAGGDHPAAHFGKAIQFARDGVFGRNEQLPPAAAARKLRHFRKRSRSRTKTAEQIGEGHRADMAGAGQPQPGPAFGFV